MVLLYIFFSGGRTMLIIRKTQMEALGDYRYKQFENRMVVHLNKFFNKTCVEMGEVKTRELIRKGVERAAKYEIVSERDVCKFIDVMCSVGERFDEDPTLPWAKHILRDKTLKSPRRRMEKLCNAAIDHVSAELPRHGQ